MKKRLLSLLLAMAMVASMVVMPAKAQPQEANITPETGLCPCGCEQLLSQIDWRPWKVNVDDERELATLFKVRSIPTLLFIPMTGNPQLSTGAMSKAELSRRLDELLK